MKGIIFEHKKHGVIVMDKLGCFRFVHGFTALPTGSEICFAAEHDEEEKETDKPFPVNCRRIALIAACIVFMCTLGVLASFWFSTAYYVEVDTIAEVELAFNHMNVLISAAGLNGEGRQLLEHEHLSGSLHKVSAMLLKVEREEGYYKCGEECIEFLEITVVAHDDTKGSSVCDDLQETCRSLVPDNTDYEHCDMAERENAKKIGVPTGKLLLAEHLQIVVPSESIDEIIALPIEQIYAEILKRERV